MSSIVRLLRLAENAMVQRPIRPLKIVEQDFLRLGVEPGFTAKRFLTRYPEDQYQALYKRLHSLKQTTKFKELLVDPHYLVANVNHEDLSDGFLLEQIDGFTLNLTRLHNKQIFFMKRLKSAGLLSAQTLRSSGIEVEEDSQLVRLLDVIAEEKDYLKRLAARPETTVDDIFRALEDRKGRLDFLNVTVYRPLNDGSDKWIVTQRSRSWANGSSKYTREKGGSLPTTTLRSVIDGDRTIYDVDIADQDSFAKAGLTPDPDSIANDLKNSNGPGRMLFIKLVSKFGREAVIHLHNRISKEENLKAHSFLPDDETRAKRIKFELEEYFEKVVLAIETVRTREEMSKIDARRGLEQAKLAQIRQLIRHQQLTLYKYLLERTVLNRYGELEIANITNPAKLDDIYKVLIVDELNWTGREYGDMEKHTVNVDELSISFDRGRSIAFASVHELPFTYPAKNGIIKEGKVVPLVGTWVREGYRGKRLQVLLNYLLLVRRWVAYKFTGGFFKPLKITTRTRSRVVLSALFTYFKNVKWRNLSPEEKAARKEFAKYLGCSAEDDGIVRNAYKEPMPDDGEKLKVSNQLARKIDRALEDLGPQDARIFEFELTAGGLLKALLVTLLKSMARRK
ncbi:MAG: hypothetical protein PHH60_02920 [Candidatus Margulisbacteria bacterium]|nr:hypothetical protein [Candidatus Margulisiibacteriota bacterium]